MGANHKVAESKGASRIPPPSLLPWRHVMRAGRIQNKIIRRAAEKIVRLEPGKLSTSKCATRWSSVASLDSRAFLKMAAFHRDVIALTRIMQKNKVRIDATA